MSELEDMGRSIEAITNLPDPAFLRFPKPDAERRAKWDARYLDLARLVSTWSKDPSTQTGAVIVAPDNSVVSLGFNGFAKGVEDPTERYSDREIKYRMIVHCERNAIILARRDLTGCTLYTYPFMSCSVCASMVIQAGIRRCVAPPLPDHLRERWGDDILLAEAQFREAGVRLEIVADGDLGNIL